MSHSRFFYPVRALAEDASVTPGRVELFVAAHLVPALLGVEEVPIDELSAEELL